MPCALLQLHESVFDVEVEILAVIAINLVRPAFHAGQTWG